MYSVILDYFERPEADCSVYFRIHNLVWCDRGRLAAQPRELMPESTDRCLRAKHRTQRRNGAHGLAWSENIFDAAMHEGVRTNPWTITPGHKPPDLRVKIMARIRWRWWCGSVSGGEGGSCREVLSAGGGLSVVHARTESTPSTFLCVTISFTLIHCLPAMCPCNVFDVIVSP